MTTVWLNHEIRPYLFRYPAMAMSAANQVSVSQATASDRHSFQVTTPVTRSMDSPRIAAVTASTFITPPKTQRPTCYRGISDEANVSIKRSTSRPTTK